MDLEVVKVLTTILVIVGHIFTNYLQGGLIHPYFENEIFVSGAYYIYSFHMPLFISVSGAVYYYARVELNKYNNWGGYIKNKLKRLISPYCFFSVFIVFPTLYILGVTDGDPLKFFGVNYILALNPRHLWFILSLFWILLFFRVLDDYIRNHKYITLLLCYVLKLYAGDIPALLQLGPTCHYIVYFYLGYLFMHYKDLLQKYFTVKYLLLFFFINVLSWYVAHSVGTDIGRISLFLREIAALSGMFYFYILAYKISSTEFVRTRVFVSLSQNAYGIYLFHPCVIYILLYISKNHEINSYLLALSVFVITLMISLYSTKLWRKIGLKFALGE